MNNKRFFELNFHIPKLQLLEVFPLTPFLWRYPECNVFDIGANVGVWSEAFLKTHSNRVVRHAMFEPMPKSAGILGRRKSNIFDNWVSDSVVVNTAMGAQPGEATIFFDQETSTLASIRNNESKFGQRTVPLTQSLTVPVSTIDAEMERMSVDTVHLAKIDVEGLEMDVLKGAEKALRAGNLKNVYLEFGVHQTKNGETFKDFFEFLSDHGMKVYKAARGTNFFGTAHVTKYQERLEPGGTAVEMLLGTLDGPDETYRGPNVIGAPI